MVSRIPELQKTDRILLCMGPITDRYQVGIIFKYELVSNFDIF